MKKNLALLIWLLLNKEQRLLFEHQNNRTESIPKSEKKKKSKSKEAASSDSDKLLSDKVPKLKLACNVPSKEAQKVFDKLLGYQWNTDIDRKLLNGIFDNPKPKPLAIDQ